MTGLGRLVALCCLTAVSAQGTWAAVSWVSPGPTLPPVELTDQDGHPHGFAQLIGERPVVVSFFFTTCARVCPPQTALLRDVQAELERRGSPLRPLVVSVSLNPLADTPAALRAYAALFDARLGDRDGWLMLTGRPDALWPVWTAFDAASRDLNEHADTLWIGHPASHHWTRVSALSPDVTPSRLADLLLQADP